MRNGAGTLALTVGFAGVVVGCYAGPAGSGTPSLPPDVHVVTAERSYDVTGSTREEILRSLAANGPSSGGRRHWGLHEWWLRWRFEYAPRRGRCAMTRVDVELESTTTIPRWSGGDGADAGLEEEWDSLVAALRIHENGHRDLSFAAARDVERALRRLETPRCSMMPDRARSTGDEIVRAYRERQEAYDQETRHGAAQNVRWPWPSTVDDTGVRADDPRGERSG